MTIEDLIAARVLGERLARRARSDRTLVEGVSATVHGCSTDIGSWQQIAIVLVELGDGRDVPDLSRAADSGSGPA